VDQGDFVPDFELVGRHVCRCLWRASGAVKNTTVVARRLRHHETVFMVCYNARGIEPRESEMKK
jgi:hypothetical protein